RFLREHRRVFAHVRAVAELRGDALDRCVGGRDRVVTETGAPGIDQHLRGGPGRAGETGEQGERRPEQAHLHGSGMPFVFVTRRSTRWLAVMNSVDPSSPQATFAVGTPVRMRPSNVPSGVSTSTPPGPVANTLPCTSTFMPSG